jgi:hypothetical protein
MPRGRPSKKIQENKCNSQKEENALQITKIYCGLLSDKKFKLNVDKMAESGYFINKVINISNGKYLLVYIKVGASGLYSG